MHAHGAVRLEQHTVAVLRWLAFGLQRRDPVAPAVPGLHHRHLLADVHAQLAVAVAAAAACPALRDLPRVDVERLLFGFGQPGDLLADGLVPPHRLGALDRLLRRLVEHEHIGPPGIGGDRRQFAVRECGCVGALGILFDQRRGGDCRRFDGWGCAGCRHLGSG